MSLEVPSGRQKPSLTPAGVPHPGGAPTRPHRPWWGVERGAITERREKINKWREWEDFG